MILWRDLFLHLWYCRQCEHIPNQVKRMYVQLKKSKNMRKGKKLYWVTSAEERGLCDGKDGIEFKSL